ncbi:MAG: hypothetical protein HGA76_01980 [Candidatus Firestonebacteria bacterium]|nr:hypothetical protein [Candidatus Firestonebacteria bacterium]
MLNPEFRLLDPEPEQLERLCRLSGLANPSAIPWSLSLMSLEAPKRETFFRQLDCRLATPGDHPLTEIHAHIRALAQELEIHLPEPRLFGFPETLVAQLLDQRKAPCVMLLGVLEDNRIWAGCLAGVSRSGLDFFTTFQTLWADEPELAAKQSLEDFPEICRVASRLYARPAGGLFIQREAFAFWGQHGWSQHYVLECVARGQAQVHWPY